MSVDVREISLHDAVKFIVDNRGKTVPTADNGIPLIATNCIKNNGLFPVFEKIRFVSEETYKTWFRSHPEPGDIIFVNKGTPGRVCLVPNPVNFCIAQDMVALRVDESVIYPKYLFAALRSDYIQNVIENMHVGTLIPHFKKSDFERLMIPVPDEVTQKYIGNLYYDLSMAIELNNQINKNLEEMAQAIFKSWFVDFEPFKDGEFEDSELGLIPKGWRVGTIGSLCSNIFSGGTPLTSEPKYWNGIYPWLSSGETRRPIIIKTEKSITDEGIINSSTRLAKKYDIVIASAGQGHTRGQTAITLIDTYINQSVIALSSQAFGYLFCNLKNRYDELRAISDSSSIRGSLTTKILNRFPIILPPKEVLLEFQRIFEVIIEYCGQLAFQNEKLSEIRDILLPKLMSGEIRVPVEEVV